MTNLSYAQPDLGRIQESREAIRYQAIVGSANLYIKALSDELIALNTAVSDLDLTAANIFTSAITALETDDLNENLQALASLNAREPSAQVEKARQQYSQIVTQLIKLCTEQMTRLHTSLHNSVFGVQSIGISNNRFRLEELAASKINLTREYDAEQIPLAELKDDETVLNLAIAEFEKLTFIDRIKPLLEQLKAIIGNKPTTPEAAALEAGLIIANKFLDEANELIKYKDLIKARQIIQTRLAQREERVASLARQLRDNDDKTRQLKDTQKVVPHQQTYVSETGKLTAALSAFLGAVTAVPNEDVLRRGERLLEHSQSLRNYLIPLQGRWLRG
ncbi:alpha-xenorhabdolysin family binary toxin subunit B [Pseudomonas sp. AO-1]|uniref:alpha-xenorhabdolysin family binary toxin subunit B n=1 Tax=Pseudomonas sp. AO-1 TaxID=2855434 RepID=UPI001C76B38D|nr:alpha-xenorhabdolysin family binary toxin subunit B [Pseudomonas sp. AO-1]QXZ13476.1 alpha-xenorhabdolysin family binary toxin subunit B [Pseudomonas sp. AO-1]